MKLFGFYINLLSSESYVVYSYSALCIERFLMIKDGPNDRFTKDDIKPFMNHLIMGLFKLLANPESSQNEYIMRGFNIIY